MTDDRDNAAWIRNLLHSDIPRDIVPGSGLDRDTLLHQNAMVSDIAREVTIPGEVIEDVDGNIIGMTASRTEHVSFGGAVVTRAQLDAAGLTPEDVPNLHVLEPPTKGTDHD
jgi:hypothetical protein